MFGMERTHLSMLSDSDLNVVEIVKYQFLNPTGPSFVSLTHMLSI